MTTGSNALHTWNYNQMFYKIWETLSFLVS